MARGLSHEFKRVIAGACALMVVTGSVPMQPVADVFNSIAMAASADSTPTYTVTYSIGNYSLVITTSATSATHEPTRSVIEDFLKAYVRDNNIDLGFHELKDNGWTVNGNSIDVEYDTTYASTYLPDGGMQYYYKDRADTITYTVTQNVTTLTAADITTDSATYTGNAIEPVFKVGNTTLTKDTDYTITKIVKDGAEVTEIKDAGTYNVVLTFKGNYAGTAVVDLTVAPADIAALTGVTTTYNGDPQNLVSGTPTAGTVFSLTEPSVDYDAEMQRVSALAERAHQAHENAPINGVERDYYIDAWSALDYYKDAISHLKNNDDTNASYCLDDTHAGYYADIVAASTFTPSADMQDVIDYIKTYIKGTDVDKTKARFTAADPVWKSADEITATDAGTYTVWYKYGGNSANYTDKVNSFTATINQATPSFTTAPAIANNGKLYYSGEKQALITEGTIGENMGTLQYAAVPNNVIRGDVNLESVEVGKVYVPGGYNGVTFPRKYEKLILTQNGDSTEYYPSEIGFNLYLSGGIYKLFNSRTTVEFGTNDTGFLITQLDEDQKVIYATVVEPSDRIVPDNLEWSTEVPERTDVGKYDVYYRVVSNENSTNYKEVAPTKFGTVEIKYRTVELTLSNLDSDDAQKPKAKIVEVTDNGEKDVQPNDGIYTLTASKTYKIYTQKTIANATVEKYLLGSQPLGDGKDYKYCYTFNIPAAADYDSAAFSHENNWKGAVYTDESDKLYIADGEVNKKTGTLAAILKGENTYYYGDTPTENDVEIQDFAKGIVRVEEIYLENSAGTRVDDLNNVAYGEYKLNARVVIDADGDTNFETGSQTTQTMYKNVVYAPRPVGKSAVFYKDDNGKKVYLDVKTETDENSGAVTYYVEHDKNMFTYDGTQKTPPLLYAEVPAASENTDNNGGTEADTPQTEVVQLLTNENIPKTDAGEYSYVTEPMLVEGNSNPAKSTNYNGTLTIKWQINKADISQYITVAPGNNVDTDNDDEKKPDAIVYDGEVLDGTDFVVTAAEDETDDTDAVKAQKALARQFVAEMTGTSAATTINVESELKDKVDSFTNVTAATAESDDTYVQSFGNSSGGNKADNSGINIAKGENTFKVTSKTGKPISKIVMHCNIGENRLENISVDNGRCTVDHSTLTIDNIGATEVNFSRHDEYAFCQFKDFEIYYGGDVSTDMKSAGDHNAKVTLTNSNYKDIVFNDVAVTIAKRKVTVTPKAGQKITYRDTVMPDLEYTYEKAAAESTTGVVAADESLFGTSDDTQQPSNPVLNVLNLVPEKIGEVVSDTEPLPVIYVGKFAQSTDEDAAEFVYDKTEEGKTDYSKAVADGIVNNAGKYDYAAGKFDNYTVVFPENADKFTVDRLDLNNIEDLNIVLTGDEQKGWVQAGNSGSYTYDGTTKTVNVNKVSKPHEDVSETIETEVSSIARPEADRRFSFTTPDGTVVEFDQKVRDKNDNNSSIRYIAAGNHEGISYDMAITPIAEKAVKTIKYYDQGDETGKTLTVDGEAGEKVSFKEAYIANGGNWNSLALLRITKLEVTYSFDEYVLEADTDYTVGGSVKSATVGEKTVQVKGKGNYTGVAKAIWEINSAEAGEATLTFKNAEGVPADEPGREPIAYNHEYDGEAVTGKVKFADPDSTYAENADVEIKYYKGNGEPSEENLLDGKPTDAGEYMVVATITCDGFEDKTLSKFLTIAPAALTVDPEQQTKESITYGDDLPAVTEDDIAAIEGLTDADREYFEQLFENDKLKFVYMKVVKLDDNDNPVTDPTTGGYILEEDTSKITLNPTFDPTSEEGKAFIKAAKNYNVIDFYWNIQTKSKSIKDKSITVEFTGGSAVVLDEEGFAESNSIVVKDTAILDANGEPTVLTEGTDYELNIESTATAGEFTVEIIGQGNYKNIRKETFTAVTSVEELASVEYTKVEIADIAKKQIRVAVKAEPEFEGYEIVKTGLVLWNSAEGEPSGELTLENAEQYDDIKTGGKAASEYSAKIKDNGAGIKVVGYVTLTDGTNTYTIYADEPVETTYDETAMESVSIDYTKVEIADMAKKQIRVAVASEVNTEGFEIVKTGLVLWNSAEGEPSGELTLENAAQYDDIKTGGTAASEYSAKIKDNGAGIKAVGYVTFTDGTNTYTKYCGEIVKTNFDQMMNDRT